MKRIDWNALDADARLEALARPRRRTETRVTDTVREIMEDVRARGGAAVTDWSLKLDGAPPRRLEPSVRRRSSGKPWNGSRPPVPRPSSSSRSRR